MNEIVNRQPTVAGGMRRPSVSATSKTSASLSWVGDKPQLDFRKKVLEAAISDRVKRGKPKFDSLAGNELGEVNDSAGVKVKSGVAKAAGEFLKAAKEALLKAQEDAAKKLNAKASLTKLESDALLTADLKISGYRSVETESRLWRSYFPAYYNRTSKSRAATGDPHGSKAVKIMVRFISPKKAPPGFSKHTLGVSVDFYQKRYSALTEVMRVGGRARWINNSTKRGKNPGRNAWWFDTWLYRWLEDNCANYGFRRLPSEAWHYDYVGKKKKK